MSYSLVFCLFIYFVVCSLYLLKSELICTLINCRLECESERGDGLSFFGSCSLFLDLSFHVSLSVFLVKPPLESITLCLFECVFRAKRVRFNRF